MLLGHLRAYQSYQPLLKHLVWQKALVWLERFDPKSCPEGEHEIQGRDMYAVVRRIQTKPREQCRFESHRDYIDLQYCAAGLERIEWTPSSPVLHPNTKYDREKDVLFYPQPLDPATTLVMSPGTFAIFFLGDAHMPEISCGVESTTVLKIVIKIAARLFQ